MMTRKRAIARLQRMYPQIIDDGWWVTAHIAIRRDLITPADGGDLTATAQPPADRPGATCLARQIERWAADGPSGPVAYPPSEGLEDIQWRHGVPRRWALPNDCGWWDAEPAVGRVADGVPRRVDRNRAPGNAVVPQVAEHVGRQLLRIDADRRMGMTS